MRFGCSSPCKFEPKKKPNALHLSLQCPICDWVAKMRPSHPKTRYPPSRLKQPLSLSLLRRICFHSVRRFAVDALSADRFLRMIFNLPPEELDTTMHSPGEYIKQAISTESDVRGSSTTNVSATCILRARDSGQNSFDVRRVKLLLQTQPDVYYGCLNGKFFCVPVLVNIHHHHHRAAGEKRVTPILITQYRVPSFDQESPPWKSILHIVRKMIDRRRAFRSRAEEIDSILEGKKIDATFL